MKKIFLLSLLGLAFLIPKKSNAQILWQDNFDSYVTDSIVEPQSSEWVGWGNVVSSSLVSSDTSFSGNNSLKIWNGTPNGAVAALSDVLHKFGDSTSGRFMLRFKVLVPSANNSGTYWNIQHVINALNVGQEWAMEVYLRPQGNASTISIAGVNYTIPTIYDRWAEVIHIFDLNRDEHDFFYNGNLITSQPFSAQSNTTVPGTNQLAGIDLFAACGTTTCTELGYFDDFVFVRYPDPLNDAGIVDIDIPSYCLGDSTSINLNYKNWGFNLIDTVTLNWSINGVLQTPVQVTDTIYPDGELNVFMGNYLFTGQPPFDIKAWTSMPNNVLDTFNFNDTSTTQVGGPSLLGNYSVDPSLPLSSTNYLSLQNLINDISLSGVCGPVNVTVAPGTYNETMNFDNVQGTSPVNTITIDGVDSSLVILENNLSATNAMLRFNASQYVTVKNMTLRSTYTGTAIHFGVHFMGNARHDSVINCRVLIDANSTSAAGTIVGASANETSNFATGNNANFVTVMNSDLQGGYYGVRFNAGGTGNYNTGNSFINNRMRNVYYYGFYMSDQDSLSLIGNRAENFRNSINYGIYAFNTMNFKIRENYVIANNYPLYVSNANSYNVSSMTAEIINNMLISNTTYGMYLTTPININIFHNSIRVEGTAEAFYFTSTFSDSLDVRNNIFSANTAPAMRTSGADSTVFLKLDNNVYHTTSGINLLNINNTLYASLAAYQTAQSNFDIRSLEGDPQFLSGTDLRIVGSFVNNTGDNFVGINIDIEGDPRPFPFSTDVDPGADEFDPPLCPPPLNLRAINASLDSVVIVVDGNNQEFQWNIVTAGSPQGVGISGVILTDSARVGTLNPSTSYDLYVREICGRGDTSLWIGPVSFSTAFAAPYFEDFETFASRITANPWPKGWTSTTTSAPRWESLQATGNNWSSGGTGPLVDHTLYPNPGGIHIFLETSGGSLGSFADFVSPAIFIDDTLIAVEFSFWYHMHGASMGDLVVMADTNGIRDTLVIISGQQQANQADPWKQFAVFLNGYAGKSVQFIFRGIRGTSFTGDMAIDDVEIKPLVNNNTAVVEMISPNLPICPGNTTPIVGVKNNGIDTITTVKVMWEVNGVLDSTIYTGQILPGDTVPVTLGTLAINATTVYNIMFYTKEPNNIADETPEDDTLALANLQTGLAAGTYTIDAGQVTGGNNFASVTDFTNAVNSYGLCGAITIDFVVGSGPYAQQIILEEVQGSSSTNTITINGNGEILRPTMSNANERAVIIVESTSYVDIDSLYIDARNGTYSWGVQFQGDVHHCSLTNSVVHSDTTSNSTFNIPVVLNNDRTVYTSGFPGSHITIDNNELIGGYFNLTAYGNTATLASNISITNNIQRDFYFYGNYIYYNDSLLVEGNDISRANRPTVSTFYGIFAGITTNGIINKNAIHNNSDLQTTSTSDAYPIYITGTTPSGDENLISNNLIYNINSNGTIYAIYNLSLSGNYFYNNTISLDDAAATAGITRGYYQSSTGTNTRFINNNISISRGGSGVKHGIYVQNATSPATIDYNNVFMNSLGTGAQHYGYQSADRTSLLDWQTNTSFGTNSHELDPQYLDLVNDDLKPNQSLINSVGLSSTYVTEDFFGIARPSNPDIGAIEFDPPPTPNASMVELVAPIVSEDTCYSSTERVVLNILNAGGVVLDFTVDTSIVEVNVTGAITTTLSVTLNDNSRNGGLPVALGFDFNVDMGTINMTTPGTYNFEAIISVPTDSFPNNDTLRETLVINPVSGGTILGVDSICFGDSSKLRADAYQGELQWQVWDGTAWVDITGATSDSYTAIPTVITDYRVLACGIVPSDTISVTPISLNAPTVLKNDSIVVFCGNMGIDSLIMVSQVDIEMKWYDAPIEGNLQHTGDTLIYTATPSPTNPQPVDTFYVAATTGGGGTGGNIAPQATVSASQCNTGPCSTLNDLNLGTCGSQQMWIPTADPPSTTPGVDWIQWDFSTPKTFDTLVIHHGQTTSRFLTGATVQYWDGAAWITHGSFSNLPLQCINRVPIGRLTADRFRITAFLPNPGPAQQSNTNFREIEIIEVTGCESSRVMVIGRIDCVTGIDDNELSETSSMSIYPNPSSGLFTLNINTQKQEQFVLTVRDVKGQMVYTGDVSVNGEYRNDLDFTGFAKGVYYLQIQTETATRVEKLIIQ